MIYGSIVRFSIHSQRVSNVFFLFVLLNFSCMMNCLLGVMFLCSYLKICHDSLRLYCPSIFNSLLSRTRFCMAKIWSFDIWSSDSESPYMHISCAWMFQDFNWKMKKKMFGCMYMFCICFSTCDVSSISQILHK